MTGRDSDFSDPPNKTLAIAKLTQRRANSGIMRFAHSSGLVMFIPLRGWLAASWRSALVNVLMLFALTSSFVASAYAAEGSVPRAGKQAAQKQVQSAVQAAVQAVVQAQLDAFAADDAKRAFSYATPRIRKVFGTADAFLAMVKASYPMVYRPASTSFFKPEKANGGWVQRVQMSDAQGALWAVTYALEMQRDGSWRINGCDVAASEGRIT